MPSIREVIASGSRLLWDGAMGTMLQANGLEGGQNPEEFCLARPDILQRIHEQYVAAGVDVLTTNTFGGTSFKLPKGIDVFDFNRRMAQAARSAAQTASKPVFVAGSVGPSGKFLQPLGDIDFETLVQAFEEQIRGLLAGGIDLVMAETQFDIAEARAIVIAARRVSDLPVAVSMTYEKGSTLTGSNASVCAATLGNMGVDLIGINCSAGPVELREEVQTLIRESVVPVLVQPNAGLPQLEGDKTVFPLGPEEFARRTVEFAEWGAQAVGGCCGTSPTHIAALGEKLRALAKVEKRPEFQGIVLTSRSQLVRVGSGHPLRIVGERINPTGKKQLSAELQAGEFTTAFRFADEQAEGGAPILDVNVGAPMVDETVLLPDLVSRLAARHALPLSIDSSNPEAVANALKVYPASPLVNSISGEEGRIERLAPLCRDFGAPFILLPLKGRELPVRASERIAIIEDMIARLDALNVPRRLMIVDALVLTISSNSEAARECLEFIRYCDQTLNLPTICGLSNISFGLPARELVNAAFLNLAAAAGMNACIANPGNARFMQAVDATNLLLGHDEGAEHFIAKYAEYKPGGGGGASGASGQSAPRASATIEEAVIAGHKDAIGALVHAALESGEDPFTLVGERLIPAITEVGAKYERKEYFLPQLIRSAETMQAAFAIVRPLLQKDAQADERPVIVMATVEGDIHDIGKNIVNLLLGNHGFEVVDLGKDVAAETIVTAAEQHQAGLIGLSALMTTTMVRMRDTIDLLQQKGMTQKVFVGGAVVTEDFARSIGAHYARDAVDAVRLAKSLLPETAPLAV